MKVAIGGRKDSAAKNQDKKPRCRTTVGPGRGPRFSIEEPRERTKIKNQDGDQDSARSTKLRDQDVEPRWEPSRGPRLNIEEPR